MSAERKGLSLGPSPKRARRREEGVSDPPTEPRRPLPPIPDSPQIPHGDELFDLKIRVAGHDTRLVELEGLQQDVKDHKGQAWWNKVGNRALTVLWILQTLALAYFRGMP